MANKSTVKILDYIGGQDEDLGGYCEPLIIRVNENDHFVLHEMHQYRDTRNQVQAEHNKVEFSTLEELTLAFKKVERKLGIDKSLKWIRTNRNCGYDISKKEWDRAHEERYAKMR